MDNLTKKIALVSLLLLVVSCGKVAVEENGTIEVEVPGTNVVIDENWAANVNVEAVVEVTEDWTVKVETDESNIVVDENGGVEIDLPGVNIDLK